MSNRDRNWTFLLQTLLLFRALQVAPGSRPALIRRIQARLPDAFDQPNPAAQRRAFERTLAALRGRLGATVDWDPAARVYRLEATGPLLAAPFTDELLVGLGVLLETFTQDPERRDVVGPLLQFLQSELAPEQLRRVSRRPTPLQLDVRRKDEAEIAPIVWQRVRYAIENRQVLRFDYMSPIHEDRVPRTHVVEPYRLDFRAGHYYLKAYQRRWSHPDGYSGGERWSNYRVDHIEAAGIAVLPEVLPPGQRSRRLLPIRYRLAPHMVRGNATLHFEEMVFSQPDEDGWVEVGARVENLFDAHRTLLSFGEMCVALDPPELVVMMAAAARRMADHYAAAGTTGDDEDRSPSL